MTSFMTFYDFICVKEKVSEELGQADSENLRGRSAGLPKCNGQMRIIAFIEEQEVIKKILTHLGLYLEKSKAFPRAPPKDLRLDSSCSQIPAFDDYLHGDPEYSIDGYLS